MSRRILIVCRNNICRSPAAEAVLRRRLERHGLDRRVEVDSAGTHAYHLGEGVETRTARAALSRGYCLAAHRARRIAWQDFEYFDLILAIDRGVLEELQRMAALSNRPDARIELLTHHAAEHRDDDVPDPYLSLGATFDAVFDMLEDAAAGLVPTLAAEPCKRPLDTPPAAEPE